MSILNRKLSAAVLAGLALVLGACNSTGGGGDISESELLGRWILMKSHTKGARTVSNSSMSDTTRIDTTTTYTGNAYYIEFKADHSYEANFPGLLGKVSAAFRAPESGTWSLSGDAITAVTADKDTSRWTAEIKDASATFSLTFDSEVVDGAYKAVTHLDITLDADKQE